MKTETGMFEFYSETLKKALTGHAEKHETDVDDILETCNYQARGEVAFVPHYEEPYMWGDEAEYPFVFVDYKSRLNREGRSANCTWYQELRDVDPGDEAWDDVAKFNPVDAETMASRTARRSSSSRPPANWSARPSCGRASDPARWPKPTARDTGPMAESLPRVRRHAQRRQQQRHHPGRLRPAERQLGLLWHRPGQGRESVGGDCG